MEVQTRVVIIPLREVNSKAGKDRVMVVTQVNNKAITNSSLHISLTRNNSSQL